MESLEKYRDVKSVKIEWLWYPYIPRGKVTILQGDPGEGKSTLMMQIISCLTNATPMPDGQRTARPRRVIYQCCEDGIADTIKPRLEKSGADCSRVAFVNEDLIDTSFDTDVLRDAVIEFKADLLVVDPFQAYIGNNADISNVKSIRKIMKKLGIWAASYDCAIILVGHMTKKDNANDLYRGIGSIDLVAAARSVLQIYRMDGSESVRYMKQIKNSLAPKGKDIGYELHPVSGFQWLECEKTDNAGGSCIQLEKLNFSSDKDEEIAKLLCERLKDGPRYALDIQEYFREQGVSIKVLKRIKKIVGVKSVRKAGRWYWKREFSDDPDMTEE